MKTVRVALLLLLSSAVFGLPGLAGTEDRAARSIKKNDRDGDGRISRDEWRKPAAIFEEIDADKDGYVTVEELRARFSSRAKAGSEKSSDQGSPGGGDRVARDAIDAETLCAIGRGRDCDIKRAIKRGMFETGLRPRFPENAECRDIDEQWAIDYSDKRDRESYHGGIDMPAPWGTPMIAAAAGTVVARYVGENSYRGMEIILRHSPEDTGIPLWIYTQYAHFDEMPKQVVGQRVHMGEVLGPTGNSGRGKRPFEQSQRRRPAIHFAVWYSTSPKYAALRHKVIPVNGQWMDPNAFYRQRLPLDSYSLKALAEAEKQVPIPVMFDDGRVFPADTKLLWPYTCKRR